MKTNQKKKHIHTNHKKIREKPILLKKKKMKQQQQKYIKTNKQNRAI